MAHSPFAQMTTTDCTPITHAVTARAFTRGCLPLKRSAVLSIVVPLLIVQTARGQVTFIPGPPSGTRTSLAVNDAACSDSRQCLSGLCIDGLCSDASAGIPTPARTPHASASIVLSTATGAPGEDVAVAMTLHTQGIPVAGTQNDIGFGPGAWIAAAPNGRPDCTTNAAINKNITSFAFRPPGCTPGTDCTGIRVLVLSTANVDPIDDGALLYTCSVHISDVTPPGAYALPVSGAIASDPEGNQVAFSGTDGAVIVLTPEGATPLPTWTSSPTPSPKPPTLTYTPVPTHTHTPTRRPTNTPRPSVALSVASATAGPDDSVLVAVSLASGGYPVAGVQADLAIDPGIAIAVNPDINKPASAFSFQPFGCQPGVSCTTVRALVLAADNVDAIPDGAVLFTCRLHVANNTPPGEYSLSFWDLVASDPDGAAWGVVGFGGEVVVVTPPGTTPIPTWTPSSDVAVPHSPGSLEPTPTLIPLAPQPVPAGPVTSEQRTAAGGGCAVDPGHNSHCGLLLLVVSILLSACRRFRSLRSERVAVASGVAR
jgi:hypothetical protein